jgi:hypothetical protein
MFGLFKGLGSSGNANYEAAKASVHKDLKIQRLEQELDDLKAAREVINDFLMKLVRMNSIAKIALGAIGDQETSGGGQASTMAWTAREALKTIRDLENT